MIKRWVATAAAMVLVSAAGTASAATISSWVGNANGFGGLVTPDADGLGFDDTFLFSNDAGSMPPPPDIDGSYVQGTDIWTGAMAPSGLVVQHAFGPINGITSATLRLFSGGWGLNGPAEVYVNGFLVGSLTVGEDPNGVDFTSFAFGDEFTLSSGALSSLDAGSASVEIRPVDPSDGGVLDYSRLTITTDAGGGTPVPEPTTWALTAMALAGLAASRRRQPR